MAIIQFQAAISFAALDPLRLSAAVFHAGDPQGTVIGNILGALPGSKITFGDLGGGGGALQIVGAILQVGPSPPRTVAIVPFNLVETLPGALGSPRQTNEFSISVLAPLPAGPSLTLTLDMTDGNMPAAI